MSRILTALWLLSSGVLWAQVSSRQIEPAHESALLEVVGDSGFFVTTEFYGIDDALSDPARRAVTIAVESEVRTAGAKLEMGGSAGDLRVRVERPPGLQGKVLVQVAVTIPVPDSVVRKTQGHVVVVWESPLELVKPVPAAIGAAAAKSARRVMGLWRAATP
jgi:hypothetical protein